MDERFASAWKVLPDYLSQHVLLSAAALGLALVICLPLAVLALRRPRIAGPVLAATNIIQTIPGLALMALFYPLLLAASQLSLRAFGHGVPALGFLPALLALTLYAMLPILRNGIAGLQGVDPDLIEAAQGVGMTEGQILLRVQVPVTAPVIMAGIRLAAVWTIGAATLATPVGQTSLGNYIFSGLQTENWVSVAFGCVASALVALAADAALGIVETGVAMRHRGQMSFGVGIIFMGLAAAAWTGSGAAAGYVLGAKNFSEQFILADLMARQIEREGASVQVREGLGSAVAFRALASNDVDAYVDYAGTLWANVLGRSDMPERSILLSELTRDLQARHGVRVLGALGFENAYALAMRADRAAALGVASIEDLARVAPQLTFGSDLEFLERPEWRVIRDRYGLSFRSARSFNPTFMYRALTDGEVDVISAFSSDGRIAADKLLVLSDPRGAIAAYDALILLSPRRASDALLTRALSPLVGAIEVERMRAANYLVDRGDGKMTPAQAAQGLLQGLH